MVLSTSSSDIVLLRFLPDGWSRVNKEFLVVCSGDFNFKELLRTPFGGRARLLMVSITPAFSLNGANETWKGRWPEEASESESRPLSSQLSDRTCAPQSGLPLGSPPKTCEGRSSQEQGHTHLRPGFRGWGTFEAALRVGGEGAPWREAAVVHWRSRFRRRHLISNGRAPATEYKQRGVAAFVAASSARGWCEDLILLGLQVTLPAHGGKRRQVGQPRCIPGGLYRTALLSRGWWVIREWRRW